MLLADDEPLSREFLQEALQAFGCEVTAVVDGREAMQALERGGFDLVVTDLKMPHADGLEVLAQAKRLDAALPVVLVTAHGTMHTAVQAMRKGADDILEKPVVLDELEVLLTRVRDRRRLLRENTFLRAESVAGELVAASPAMQTIVDLVQRVAPSRAAVLVHGESGTGKERVATLVHKSSDRRDGPFVKLNCAAIPEALLESELFGHEAGAFTGANRRREGRFELADGGTLFLDEIGEMSPAMQAKLLRVLQEGEFERVGGNATIRVDVRIVAATNRDLAAEVEAGRFRGDLLWRLNVVPIVLPPLRDRTDEIVPLARHFLRPGLAFAAEAEQALREWSWPGNVRELQNLVQRVGLFCEGGVVTGEMVRQWLQPSSRRAEPTVVLTPQDPYSALVGRPLAVVEHELVRRTLAHNAGNRTRTAEMLGIGVRTLFNKLQGATPPVTEPRTS
ncbi:MAG: sigma-54 dependent transcriptional regulator [Planctomycetes bacterium]|nr:sigma-54 dependent transcriptional regulator [Planctomycetota bacterium]MCC7397858.1 sigma-54-dependent Fis family transcriptional regulator [Planctomycetota bacterium]